MENPINEYLSNNNTEEGSCRLDCAQDPVSWLPCCAKNVTNEKTPMSGISSRYIQLHWIYIGENKGVCKWQMAIINYVQKRRMGTTSTGRQRAKQDRTEGSEKFKRQRGKEES